MANDHSTVTPSDTNATIEQLVEELAGTFESEEFLREVVTQSVLKIQRNEPVEPDPYLDHLGVWFGSASQKQKDGLNALMDAGATSAELQAFVGYAT